MLKPTQEPLLSPRMEKAQKTTLEEQLEIAKSDKHLFDLAKAIIPGSGVTIMIVSLVVHYFFNQPVWLAVGIFYFLVSLAYLLFPWGYGAELKVQSIETEILLQKTGASDIEKRAERMFREHGLDLRRYYLQTLRQGNLIFIAGLICIGIGFFIIISTFYFVWKSPTIEFNDFNEKVLATSFGLISGILINFIAAIYIRMFSVIMQSLTDFHNRLAFANQLYFANYISSKIDDTETREKVLGDMTRVISGREGR